jgi:erythritol/L-threitol dehydrogenase
MTNTLPTTMRAIVARAPHEFKLEQVSVPEPGPDELLVKVEACGVCASDVKAYKGAESYWGGPTMAAWVKAPFIPGHEFIGHVAAFGSGTSERLGLAVGDRVTATQLVPCGVCRYCLRGQSWMCQVHNIFGFQGVVNGAWADYMLFPKEAQVHKVPADMPMELAVLTEPVSCSVHAVERAKIEFGDVVVISGAGPIGLAMVGLARLRGPRVVISLDLDERRLELARSFGADYALNPKTTDVLSIVRDMTDGYGCDVYIEAAGHPSSISQGLAMIRKLGRFVEFSVFGEPATIDWSLIGEKKELDVYGSHLSPYTYPVAIDFLNRRLIKMDGVVTQVLPLESVEEALHLVADPTKSIKVVLKP